MSRTANVFWTALAYFVAAKFALLLAIEPGFASPIWPAAGIAFAFAVTRQLGWVALGVFIGSAAANATQGASWVSFAIAAGAAAQTLVGGALAGPVSDRPTGHLNCIAVIAIGCASCAVNAIVGPVSLGLVGLVDTTSLGQHIWTWWAGDAAGLAVVTPLVLALVQPKPWAYRWGIQLVPVGVLVALGIVYRVSPEEPWSLPFLLVGSFGAAGAALALLWVRLR